MTKARVETTSKYTKALNPVRPSRLRSPMEAMPWTTVQKIMGAIIIFTSLINPSPSGLRDFPNSGKKAPTRIPAATASNTCT